MSETTPQKKLVSKRRYLSVLGEKLGMYSLAGFSFMIGLMAIVGTVALLLDFLFPRGLLSLAPVLKLLLASVLAYIGMLLLPCSKGVYEQAEALEPVAPITQHNVHLLPEQEILVRGSSTPKAPQEELLRSASSSVETPAEQLVRPLENQ